MEGSNKMQDKGVTDSPSEDVPQIASVAVNVNTPVKGRRKGKVSKQVLNVKSSENEDKGPEVLGVKRTKLNTTGHPDESVERARSRSKSPRGNNVTTVETVPAVKKELKPQKAQKRKANNELENSEKCRGGAGPKPKLPKNAKKNNLEDACKTYKTESQCQSETLKPKRKYVRKNKVQTEDFSLTSKCNLDVKAETCKEESAHSSKQNCSSGPLENGELSVSEAKALVEKVKKKPGPKKGFKKKSKVEADSTTLPKLSDTRIFVNEQVKEETTKQTENEADSDTVEYSVNAGGISQYVEILSSNKNVVKIDDIEITELSDLNSSREESADENDMEHMGDKTKTVLPTFISIDECEQPDKTFLCSYPNCKYVGKTRVSFRKHLTHHQIFLCAHCEYHCNVYNELESHMRANHPQRWGRKKCKKCQRYIKGDAFDGHEEKCDGTMQFPCEQCDKVFKYESKRLDHERKLHASIKCEHCEFIADNKTALNKHVTTAHPRPKKPKIKKAAKVVKPETKRNYFDETEFNVGPTPIISGWVPSVEDVPRSASPVGTVLISPLDDTPDKITAVPMEQLTDFPFDTTIRDAILPAITSIPVPFVEKDSMQITSDSSGQVTLSIPEPTTTNSLMSPDSTTPMLSPPENGTLNGVQMCDVDDCGQVLKTYRLLINHKKSVHNILPSQQMHPCEHPDCSLVFKKKGQLKKHQVVHTGERKYMCTYEGCGKAFRHNANLKIHNLLHTGEKPIKCRFCDFACRQKSSLIHHMKTKHKDVRWPVKGDIQSETALIDDSDEQKNEENVTDSKTDLESWAERVSDADLSFESNNSDHESKTENTLSLKENSNMDNLALMKEYEPNVDNHLSANQEAKLESVLSQNFEPKSSDAAAQNREPRMESMVSFNSSVHNAPIVLSTPTKAMVKAMAPGFMFPVGAAKPLSPAVSFASHAMKSDVYDFDEEDENEPNKPVPPKPIAKKTPSKAKLIEAVDDVTSPTKKKRGPRKKKDESVATAKAESSKGKKSTPKKKKNAQEPIAVDIITPMHEVLVPVLVNTETEVDSSTLEIEPDGDSLVEEHVSENPPPLSTTSSESAPVGEEPEHAAFDDNMGPPHAPAPAFTHHDHSPLSGMEEEIAEAVEPKPVVPNSPIPDVEEIPSVNPDQVQQSPFSEISPVSQEQVMSNDTNRALSSVASMQSPIKEPLSLDQQTTPLDMHVSVQREHEDSFDMTPDELSPHKKVNSSFDLPNDIDPDEAAKILEESDEREKNMRNEKGHIRDVAGEFVPVLHGVKESFKYISSPPRSVPTKGFPEGLHLPAGTERANVGETSPYEFPNYRQHPTEFSHIQGIEGPAKDPVAPGVYVDPSQRRPSSSYVPDFLPAIGTTSAGPPSVSSSYSTHSNPVTQNHTDLSTYGASSAAGLPSYPPPSSSVPSYIPPSSVTSYPCTTPVTTTSYSERATSVGNSRPDLYRLTDSSTATTTTSSTLHPSSYSSRDLFPHYFQDPSLPLPPVGAQQDPRSLTYPPQQSSLQALQRSSADFLQRASAGALPGMNYPSVTESLARLSQTSSQQPWMPHDERTRPWAQASPILMPPEIDTASSLNRHPFSATRPELSSLDPASKRTESAFPGVPQTVSSATDRYDVASAYMGSGHFNPAGASSNYTKSLSSSVNPQKQLEEAYRQSAAVMNDYRSLSHAPPSMTDVYSRMGMNPALGLEKYYPYSREAMYRSQQLGTHPFMPQTSTTAQMPYSDRDYTRNPYAQESAYGKYLPGSNLTQSLPPALQGAGDYFPPRPGAPDPYMHDPYRRSVIHNMMSRFYN